MSKQKILRGSEKVRGRLVEAAICMMLKIENALGRGRVSQNGLLRHENSNRLKTTGEFVG